MSGLGQPQACPQEQILTRSDVDLADKAHIAAADRYEWLGLHNAPTAECEQAMEDMLEAEKYAAELEEIYRDQYRRREYLSNGRWTVREQEKSNG